MRISDWSSDVCSSDLDDVEGGEVQQELDALGAAVDGATEAAGLPLHVEAQRKRVAVAEGGKRRPSPRILLHGGEQPVANLAQADRGPPHDTLAQQTPEPPHQSEARSAHRCPPPPLLVNPLVHHPPPPNPSPHQ